MSDVCRSAIAVQDFDPNAQVADPPPGELLVFKRGDTLLVSKQSPGWIFGGMGPATGWVPISAVHLFPQYDALGHDTSSMDGLSSDIASLTMSSRKYSDQSSASSEVIEPQEMDSLLASEILSYPVVEMAEHSAIWVPYHHNGSVFYVDTRAKIMSRQLPFLPLDEADPESVIPIPVDVIDKPLPIVETEMRSLISAARTQPCLYKNNDFYRFLRPIVRPTDFSLKCLWTRLCSASPTVKYATWAELMEGFMGSIETLRLVQNDVPKTDEGALELLELIQNVTAHTKAICLAAHVPPGTNPCLGLGAIAAAYRFMLHSMFELHTDHARGVRLSSVDDLTHSVVDFVALFHMISGYPTVEIVPLPATVQVSVLKYEWCDFIYTVDPKTADLSLARTLDQPSPTKQAMPLEASLCQAGICAMILQDMEEKRDRLEDAVNSCINLWNEICEQGLKNPDGIQDSGVELFSSLHAVMSIYKSIVHILDCTDLRQFVDGAHPRLNDMSILLRVRKGLYQSLLSIEHTWARPQSALCVTDEYASAIKAVPQLYTAIDNFPKLLKSILPSAHAARWDPDSETREECVFDSQGHLRAATKEKLVEHLTQHVQPRTHEVSAFLTTFPAFMQHLELVDLLQDRFSIQPSTGLSRREFREWEVHVQRPTRLRVVNMLRMWIESLWTRPDTEEEEQRLFQRLEMLLRVMEVQEFPGSQRLHELLLRRRASDAESIVRKSSSTLPLLDPLLPSIAVKDLVAPTQLSPIELARQLTLIEWGFFMDVSRDDCLRRALERPARSTAISDFVTHWNRETCWVSNEVLSGTTPEDRALRIAYFVEVAVYCREIKNYSTMMSVLSALSSAGIHRLRQTWAVVSPKTKDEVEGMTRLMNSSRNFQEYRDILSLVSEAAVPFFGVCLMDLRFAQDGNSDHVHGDEKLVNFAKWSMVANIIDSTLRFQKLNYRLTPLPHVCDLITECLDAVPSLNDQYPLSLEREARANGGRPPIISRVSSRGH